MNSTLSIIIFAMYVLFAVYKVKNKFFKKKSKCSNEVVIKNVTIDKRFYSIPSFDFQSIQHEYDMKAIEFCSDRNKIPDKLNVIQYCKY